MIYISLLSTKPGLQQCLNHTGLNSKNGVQQNETFLEKKVREYEKTHMFFSHCTLSSSLCPLRQSS